MGEYSQNGGSDTDQNLEVRVSSPVTEEEALEGDPASIVEDCLKDLQFHDFQKDSQDVKQHGEIPRLLYYCLGFSGVMTVAGVGLAAFAKSMSPMASMTLAIGFLGVSIAVLIEMRDWRNNQINAD